MPATIVLIDDDEDDLEIMRAAINEVDSSVLSLSYTNPEEAIYAIGNELVVCPDYIFIDINMAPFTGDKCLKELREKPELKDTKIAMFSTSIPKWVAQSLIESGANFTFQKPDKFHGCRDILREVLFGRSKE